MTSKEKNKTLNLAVFTINMPFKMSVQGGLPLSICSQIQKCLNLIRGGVAFFKNILNPQKSELSKWVGGSGIIGTFPIFFVYFLIAPLRRLIGILNSINYFLKGIAEQNT